MLRRRWAARPGDAGSAAVEFATIGVLLMIPLVYLMITLGRIQAGSLAAQAGASAAARALTTADSAELGGRQAAAASELALADQGFGPDDATLRVTCSQRPCLTPGAEVEIQVEVRVGLPLVPGIVDGLVPLGVSVTASHLAIVDEFREAGQ